MSIFNVPATSSLAQQDATSMSTILLGPLNELQTLSQALFLSLSAPQKQPPPPVSSLLACDQALSAAVNLTYRHQLKQRRIESLKSEILDLDERWQRICTELELEKRELEQLISEGDERIETIEQAKKASIPYPELLSYAQSLSAFTSAPPNMPDQNLPGQPPPPLFFPPFPNEEKMRKGHLNAEAPLGLLGETHSVGKAPTVSPRGPDVHHHGVNPYRHDLRDPQPQFFDLDLDLNPDL
ncbi:hypothetical protein E1B28_007601 [Marasmius oreades]|uniref:Mediator of RNA polymerase II transcription subunit 4 n=1 Tax=Marasmius oreades TaxID=181124 RepID=A0A9P7S1Z1_9AGAR|nr:uncharacterized protein E1B28_007601 [Marasmius oreades]KAG7093971.1 hypothetical protein E1B28_007601 [Marasmius oreades]